MFSSSKEDFVLLCDRRKRADRLRQGWHRAGISWVSVFCKTLMSSQFSFAIGREPFGIPPGSLRCLLEPLFPWRDLNGSSGFHSSVTPAETYLALPPAKPSLLLSFSSLSASRRVRGRGIRECWPYSGGLSSFWEPGPVTPSCLVNSPVPSNRLFCVFHPTFLVASCGQIGLYQGTLLLLKAGKKTLSVLFGIQIQSES